MKPIPLTTDEIILKILSLEFQQHDIIYALEELVGGECPNLYMEHIFDIALDLMGVPPDNTVETNADSIANETGQWPDHAFCRDCFSEKWDETDHSSPVAINQYIKWVRQEMADFNAAHAAIPNN